MDDRPHPQSRAMMLAVDGVLVFCLCLVALDLVGNLLEGGHHWQQGDWLINSVVQDIRRGPLGSALIFLADLFGQSPVWTTGVVQLGLLATLGLCLRALLHRLDHPTVALILLASSGLFVFFWAANLPGGLRKELIIFTAIALLLLGLLREDRRLLMFCCLTFTGAVLAHEALVLFVPLALGLLVMTHKRGEPWVPLIVLGTVLVAIAGVAFLYAMRYPEIGDFVIVCRPLLARGAAPEMCYGAIYWLQFDSGYGAELVRSDIIAAGQLPLFLLGYLAALLPLIWLASRATSPLLWIAIVLAVGLPFAPLFSVAIDWGRWVSFHAFSAVIVLLAGLLTGRLRFAHPPTPVAAWAFLLFGLLVGPTYLSKLNLGGVIWSGLTSGAPPLLGW